MYQWFQHGQELEVCRALRCITIDVMMTATRFISTEVGWMHPRLSSHRLCKLFRRLVRDRELRDRYFFAGLFALASGGIRGIVGASVDY
jgi:hypothetical protein